MNKFLSGLPALGMLAACGAFAQTSPVGLWKSIDDETGKPKSLVRITETEGEFRGRIEKLFRATNEDPHPVCKKCNGAHKDKPVVGLTIISGMRAEDGEYGGGEILDPASGKIYKSKMSLSEDGKKLNVRGYVGMPVFGRTQTWMREE